ncbi:unnamed protein product (macronuclear) [Paramecium tetraurelia]|uniref:Uncharacterized protein n=1 Tax=Paramecium tetraurelia TaxID=5888 RepID=A0CDC4_PARTE|nr:uncharacterized protein GSPATT00007002001 [Paramecium tetraurelia]CAK68791.1 unnamed protein product [Paramecium tetraurelia]|eukprot:XP_001436188.1 hypothetical protein (macronuclear) [Paramecium tetraurelia strain d4-2]
MSLRRMRSGGVHADSEEDYLNKIGKMEKQQKRKTYVQETETFEGFIMNSQFTFDCFGGNPILKTTQQSHFILIMIDDFSLSPKRLFNMMENTDNCETMTQSTNDDSIVWSSQPMNYDCVVHNYTMGQVNHLFNLWIINTPVINYIFKCMNFYLLFPQSVIFNYLKPLSVQIMKGMLFLRKSLKKCKVLMIRSSNFIQKKMMKQYNLQSLIGIPKSQIDQQSLINLKNFD